VDAPYEVEDLLTGEVSTWQGDYNEHRLDPVLGPARVLRIRRPGWQEALP
jgi:hypothetical protein